MEKPHKPLIYEAFRVYYNENLICNKVMGEKLMSTSAHSDSFLVTFGFIYQKARSSSQQ